MRPLTLAALAVAGLTAHSVTPAAADSCSGDEECAKLWNKPRFEGAFGMLAGGYSVATVSGGAIGMHVDGGLRSGRLAILGEYDFLSIGQSSYEVTDPIRGQLHRVGANLRYSLAAFGGNRVPIRGDFWVEGGLGSQLVQWNGGGELSRRDMAFGAGGQMTVRIGKQDPNYIGFYYAFRGIAARDPGGGGGEPTCAGPCDTATSPSPYDIGAFFNFGVVFSR